MPIQSMTGFGKNEVTGTNYTITVEIKTVNNRFKDIRFKMGQVFNSLELKLKKELEKHFNRGSFDVYVNYRKNPGLERPIELDLRKVESFISEINALAVKVGAQVAVNPADFLRSDFYLEDESKEEELHQLLLESFDGAIKALKKSRIEEGEKLVKVLQDHLDVYWSYFQTVEKLKDGYQQTVREKLLKRFSSENLPLQVEEQRFLQEVIFYLEKLDIDEEINRIKSHVEKLKNIFNAGTEVGRQIDFLVQELGRETNTIGSKSGHNIISEAVVQMKVQLEKIREQGLNLE